MSEDTSLETDAIVSLQGRFAAFYLRDKDSKITNFTPISDGWETEVYAFTLSRFQHSMEMILRMYPGALANAVEKCEREFSAITSLKGLDYPVPRTNIRWTDPAVLGKPFLTMERIIGRPLGDVMREDTARQPELLTRFVQLAVDLHCLDYRMFRWFAGVPLDPLFLSGMVQRWRERIVDEKGQAWAIPILDWLTPQAQALSPTFACIHGDFHPHNVLITPDDQLYVIDWSGFSIGDYRYDLAWTLLLISSSGYPQLRDLILSEYERLAGQPVENIEYFDVLAALRRLVDLAVSLGSGAELLGMRPEAVIAMRAQQDRYQYVYGLLRDRTGLRVPYLEELIASLNA